MDFFTDNLAILIVVLLIFLALVEIINLLKIEKIPFGIYDNDSFDDPYQVQYEPSSDISIGEAGALLDFDPNRSDHLLLQERITAGVVDAVLQGFIEIKANNRKQDSLYLKKKPTHDDSREIYLLCSSIFGDSSKEGDHIELVDFNFHSHNKYLQHLDRRLLKMGLVKKVIFIRTKITLL